ncbi:MAG: FAD-dependent oxidoreductase [Desulfomonilaceae bacterium]|nr:FAD-dependent oxidoreductase [Desulfomonilaceae bacterium]
MGKDLVFVGGGHAHLTALVNLKDYTDRGRRVTLISPVDRHYYSGMGPGMLSGMYAPREIRFDLKKLVEDRGAQFMRGKVVRVHPEKRILDLEDGSRVSYDVVSFNTGSYVPLDLVKGSMEHVFPVKPIVNLLKAKRAVVRAIEKGRPELVVLGGGPAGLELTGNIRRLVTDNHGDATITLIAGRRLLPNLAEKARTLALASLKKRNIKVIEGVRADRIEDNTVIFTDGNSISFDLVFPAVGVKSYPIFKDSNLPVAEDGALTVNRHLHSVAYPNIFGGGDCVSLEDKRLDRVGVYAVRQNPILHANLTAALEGGEMKRFTPQETYLLIFNLGDGTGIFVRKSWVWNGTLAFKLKDYIDRKFMKTFQVSGEREDTRDYPDG